MTHNYLDNTGADIRLLGVPNINNPFCQFNSAPRVSMFNHHLSQTMVLNNPEFPKTFTGVEKGFIPYSFDASKRDHLCEIVAIIPKYQPIFLSGGMDECPEVYVITLTVEPATAKDPNGRRRLDYFLVKRYFMGSNGFGFVPVLNERNRRLLQVGTYLEPEQVITHSPAVQGDQYCLGTNLKTIYGSFPETIEDAFIISESAAKKLQTVQVSEVVINCRMDRRPLNLNGDQYTDKFLPDIGSFVREDGALCAFRPVHWTTCIADSDKDALREPLMQDNIIYAEPGAKIVDLTFNINLDKRNNCYPQAERYMRNNTECWKAIYQTYLRYKGKNELTPKMSTLVYTAMCRMLAQGAHVPALDDTLGRKRNRNFDLEGVNGQLVDFMQIIVNYTVPRNVSTGTKISDNHGSRMLLA